MIAAPLSSFGALGGGSGEGEVARGAEVFVLTEDLSTCIPMNTKYRLSNKSARPLEIIEVGPVRMSSRTTSCVLRTNTAVVDGATSAVLGAVTAFQGSVFEV